MITHNHIDNIFVYSQTASPSPPPFPMQPINVVGSSNTTIILHQNPITHFHAFTSIFAHYKFSKYTPCCHVLLVYYYYCVCATCFVVLQIEKVSLCGFERDPVCHRDALHLNCIILNRSFAPLYCELLKGWWELYQIIWAIIL